MPRQYQPLVALLRDLVADDAERAHAADVGIQRPRSSGPGIPADPALVYSGDFHFEAALVAATDMLKLDDPPTAIFAGSDMQAMGVYEAARLHRRRIPDDLSVVGFDDLPMSGWVSPPLTTIIQPRIMLRVRFSRRDSRLLEY